MYIYSFIEKLSIIVVFFAQINLQSRSNATYITMRPFEIFILAANNNGNKF